MRRWRRSAFPRLSSVEGTLTVSLIDYDQDEGIYNTDVLRRIANVLGEPPAVFFDGISSGSELSDTCEMLRIWYSLERLADRRKVLAFLRAIAAQS